MHTFLLAVALLAWGGGSATGQGNEPKLPHLEAGQQGHPPADPKAPPVVFIEYGTDRRAVDAVYVRKPLEACGIKTETLIFDELVPVNNEGKVRDLVGRVKAELARRKLHPDSYVIVSAHGSTMGFLSRADGERLNRERKSHEDPIAEAYLREPSTKLILGDEIVRVTHDLHPGSRVYVDSCFSGACLANSGSLATSCRKNEQCNNLSQGWHDLVDLLCDARNECRLFNVLDKDHDGILSPAELETYFYADYNVKGEECLEESREKVQQWIANKRELCLKIPLSRFDSTDRIQLVYELSFVYRSEKTRQLEKLVFTDSAAFQRWRNAQTNWPHDCGFGRRDCKLQLKGHSSWVSCFTKKAELRKPDAHSLEGNPELRTYKIDSDLCKRKWEADAKKKP